MILRRMELKQFGRFGSCSFEFRRGLNLIVGSSESGKSTLAEAVPVVLFGANDRDRFRPWGSKGGCAAALTFEASGRTLRVERDLITDQVTVVESEFDGQTLNRFTGRAPLLEETKDRSDYQEHLRRLFGLAEEDLFRLGLLFEQGGADRFGAGGLAGGVEELLSKFTGNAPSDPPEGGGKEDIEAVRSRLSELEQRWFETRKALTADAGLQERASHLEREIEADRSDFARGEKFLAQVRRKIQGEPVPAPADGRQGKEQEGVTDLEARRQALERDLAKTGLPRQIPSGLSAVLVQADEIRQEMIAIQRDAAELRQQLLKLVGPSWKPAAAVTLLIFAAAGALVWLRPGWLTAGLTACGLASVLTWTLFLWRAMRERGERGRLKGPLQLLEERREEAQCRLEGLDGQFVRLGLSPSAVEIVRMQKNLERHQRLLRELEEVEGALGTEKDQKPEFESALSETQERRAAEKASPSPLSREEFEEAEAKLALLGESLKHREQELQELTRRTAAMENLREELRRIEEEGELLRRRESELASRSGKSRLPAEESAVAGESPRTWLERFAADVGQTLTALTGARYNAVRFEKENPPALRGGDGEWHPLDQFSRGTVESFYFALRLAIGRHLPGERRLPLLLDDPLAGLDKIRQTETLKVLERLAAEQQVILFSGDEALRKKAVRERWHTISLNAEKAKQPSKSQERNDDDGQLHLL